MRTVQVCVNKLSVQETVFKSGLSARLTECGGEILHVLSALRLLTQSENVWKHIDNDSLYLPLSALRLLTQSENVLRSFCHVLSLSWLSRQSDSWDGREVLDDEKQWTWSVWSATFFWVKRLLKDRIECKLFSDSSISSEVDEVSVDKFTGLSLKIKLQAFWLKGSLVAWPLEYQ